MELAAARKVTREEDRIYSLMGILHVGIPVAYGEGPYNALTRMIREIMVSRRTFMDIFNHDNSHSIVPWDISDCTERSSPFRRHAL